MFSQPIFLPKPKNPICLRRTGLPWCGPGSLTAVRQGSLRQLLFSIPKNKKTPSALGEQGFRGVGRDPWLPAGREPTNTRSLLIAIHSQKQKTPTLLLRSLWCGPGSNRRHKDFQSFALPTELPHHSSTPIKGERGANIRTCGFIQILSPLFLLQNQLSPLIFYFFFQFQ